MMNTPTKKLIVSAGALVVLVLVSCGLTGCKLPWSKGGNQGDSAVTNTNTAEIPGLPPDPGEAGKATLAGIDSDNDGVRDDVQRYIAMTYRDSAKTRAALTQVAKVKQSTLVDANDKTRSIKHMEETVKSFACLWYVTGSVDVYGKMESDLRPIVLNTKARNKAYFDYSDQLGDGYFPGTPYDQRASACTFDIASLPN